MDQAPTSPDVKTPEIYYTTPKDKNCPNSALPVLVYRNVLPADLSVESAERLFASNNWSYDQCWAADGRAHFHSNTHECYAALRGSTKCLYGVGVGDEESEGVVFHMKAGDIAVHAAGVSHKNMESEGDYLFMGIYPSDSPPYDSHTSACSAEDIKIMAERARKVPIPLCDPIYGMNGPLPTIWNEALHEVMSLPLLLI